MEISWAETEEEWKRRKNEEIYNLYQEGRFTRFVTTRRLQCLEHLIILEEDRRKGKKR